MTCTCSNKNKTFSSRLIVQGNKHYSPFAKYISLKKQEILDWPGTEMDRLTTQMNVPWEPSQSTSRLKVYHTYSIFSFAPDNSPTKETLKDVRPTHGNFSATH